MTYEQINQMVESIGIESVYGQFSELTQKPAPYVCFYYPRSADLYADDSNYATIARLRMELYTDQKDFGLEETIERILTEQEITWRKSETYIDQQQLHSTIYESEVIINGE